MEKIINNLTEIEKWIDKSPDPETFQNNNEFMRIIVELMNYCLYLLQVSVSLAPSENIASRGYSKNKAIVIGHLVRITKLYEGIIMHISERQSELAIIFFRLIYESVIQIEYLIRSKSKRKTFHSFILTSYKPEKEILEDLNKKAASRPLINIEKRIIRKIKYRLRQDRISLQELMNNKTWSVDGKNVREISKVLGMEEQYIYIFANGSHYIHGDWCEIDLYHINKYGRFYTSKLNYTTPDPRMACPVTTICLITLMEYLKWLKADPDGVVSQIAQKLLELNVTIDVAHERTLGA